MVGKNNDGISYKNYIKTVKSNGDYFCNKCTKILYGLEKTKITKLRNGKSLFDWCIKYNRYEVLQLWDYDMNKNITPKDINFSTPDEYYFKCPKGVHKSERKAIVNFTSGDRPLYCSQCNSIGVLYPKSVMFWSDKNKKSAYEYSQGSNKKVWWKCSNNIHDDFYRTISNSKICDFRCPKCQYSRGEDRILKWLTLNNIRYEPQKIFSGLIGVNGGNLSYDFYLPEHNILIEYQGIQHEKYICGFHSNKYMFENQLEHDKLKKEFSQNNNIDLLEIWYYDFENVENILELKIQKEGNVL